MNPPAVPSGLIHVKVPKAVLLLTQAEYAAGIRRGKQWKRRTREAAREEKRQAK
jgi:hypothetical protein